ncbi:NAD-dependent epimerase/dehydratase [Pochonia chlamydosporia 170]|uniref:NAD-dependent epimerase/dehydratase n=1 Tax=Pochonia chlamydosporia 170 TaxID=1380566 RepID=A0A179F5W1_METCM|nr:NAD-dependent epimerase/dehydratase [Pochonia chlamydosporia 170]OAQ60750.1 NAD-dependent epimerase/dehydratase [Pochonia chlamydosporia 170]
MTTPRKYAVLGSTGNCGTALINNLLRESNVQVNAYCRSRAKLLGLFPDLKDGGQIGIFEGSIHDVELLASCIRGCRTVFLVVSTNDNIPGCSLAKDTALSVIEALQRIREVAKHNGRTESLPKLILLSSATIDDQFSRHVPYVLRQILYRSASYVYKDLIETEELLKQQEDWLTSIYFKPGALSIDVQRGHAISLTDETSPLSYLDLAAAMIEAADDNRGMYSNKSVSVVNTNGNAKFPSGTIWCIFMGLIRHTFPFLHPYLPVGTGPK